MDPLAQRVKQRRKIELYQNQNCSLSSDFNQDIAFNVVSIEQRVDAKKPIKINGKLYKFFLVFDTSEERRKGRREKVKLEDQFNKNQAINAKPCRLSIGDFCWVLQNVDDEEDEWLYPIIVERKRKDDLVSSIKDKRYAEQKWRMKHKLPHFDHIYLIEEYQIKEDYKKKQIKTALIKTESCDGFMIVHTVSMVHCIRVLSKWTHMIYEQILVKLAKQQQQNANHDFFAAQQCLAFGAFNSSKDAKKGLNAAPRIHFGQDLMCIPGVTDSIAACVIAKYPTSRVLWNAFDNISDVEKQKSMLHDVINGTCYYMHRDLDTGIIDLDEDLQNACNNIDISIIKPISKNLSEKIWKSEYNAVV